MIISSNPDPTVKASYSRTEPFRSRLIEKVLLTKPGSTKQTYHLSLSIKDSSIQYRPGDSIGVLPQNNPILVQHILDALKADPDSNIVDPRSKESMMLRDFLSSKANLARLTSSFLKLIHEYEPLHEKKNKLTHLLDKENKELLLQYLSTHDPLDILKEYSEMKLPLQDICAQFGPLLPRFYSISSSYTAYPDQIDLTVALFTFSHSGEQRFGVASHFLCSMAQENKTEIPIYIQPSHSFFLPDDPGAPIIMVGPGTGVAPYRAFIQERKAIGASGKNWLFFGERNKQYDFFYRDYFEPLQQEGFLKLDLAFSRDQTEKIYVQHKMLESAKDLWQWLEEGAYFYVCGDAHRMAKDVDHALHQIVQIQGNKSEEEAKAYVKELKLQKRYRTDVY